MTRKANTPRKKESCPKCFDRSDPFEFVRLKWQTNGGKQKNELVCTDCYDKEIVKREKKLAKDK